MGTSVHRLDSSAVMTLMTESVLKQKHSSVVVAGRKAGYTRKAVRPGDACIYYALLKFVCAGERIATRRYFELGWVFIKIIIV